MDMATAIRQLLMDRIHQQDWFVHYKLYHVSPSNPALPRSFKPSKSGFVATAGGLYVNSISTQANSFGNMERLS